jgi:hypothetical protein
MLIFGVAQGPKIGRFLVPFTDTLRKNWCSRKLASDKSDSLKVVKSRAREGLTSTLNRTCNS